LQEDPPSTIQERLQTPDTGRVFPTFGSFDEDTVNSADGHEDDKEGRPVEGSLPDEADQSSPTGSVLRVGFLNISTLYLLCVATEFCFYAALKLLLVQTMITRTSHQLMWIL
jgi:hypothetical protein